MFMVMEPFLSFSLGTGMYVVIGMVSKNVAGPAVALSFCFAAVSALLSGEPCYFFAFFFFSFSFVFPVEAINFSSRQTVGFINGFACRFCCEAWFDLSVQ